MTKKPWLSKTLWFNVLAAVTAMAVPPVNAYLTTHPEAVALGWSVVNIVLRLVSHEKLSLED